MQRDPGPALWVEWEPTLGLLRADLLQRIGKPLRSAHPSGAAQQSQVAVTQASAGLLGVLKYDRCSPRYRRGGGDRGAQGARKSRWALPWIANQLFGRFSVIGSERECSECFYQP